MFLLKPLSYSCKPAIKAALMTLTKHCGNIMKLMAVRQPFL